MATSTALWALSSPEDRKQHATKDVDQLHAIGKAFPSVWRDRKTSAREQKRMVRLVIEDATIL